MRVSFFCWTKLYWLKVWFTPKMYNLSTILSTNKVTSECRIFCLHHFQSWLTDFYLRWLSFFESDQIRYISCYSNDVGVTKHTTRSRKLAVWRQLTESLKSAYLHHGILPQNWTDALLENWCFTAEETSQTHENEKKKSHHVYPVSLEKQWLQLAHLT